ncbi:glycosyltransferase [Flavobacteriaceae bacterium Ap0902]|nr:glycosyltransferase [Flavobacteriaceae bacterium Ap0902]
MLSICIPVYNHSFLNLAKELHKQCRLANIAYELLVSDDCSTYEETLRDIKEFKTLSHTQYIRPNTNLGNDQNRNLLARSAQYDWLLFIDADMKIVHSAYIQNYLDAIKHGYNDVYSGGIIYGKLDNTQNILRWKFGKKHEQIQNTFNEDAFLGFRGSNFIIKKEVFLKVQFLKLPQKYGYQDTVFGINLKLKGYKLKLIYNPAEHLGLLDSETFIQKTRESIEYADYLNTHYPEIAKFIKIIRVFRIAKRLYLYKLIAKLFTFFETRLYRNLISKNPSLQIFQLYKLGFFCQLNYLKTENVSNKIDS